jgi:ABC-type antimicrobial peptide transport system ATPase subunit
MTQVLEISNLAVTFDTPDGDVEAVKGVSFTINQGEDRVRARLSSLPLDWPHRMPVSLVR